MRAWVCDNLIAAKMQEKTPDNKSFIRRMFQDILENDLFDEQAICRYFSPRYIQHVDGKTLTFEDFADHLRELKQAVTKMRFTFDHIVAEGDKVMEIHSVEGEKRNGGKFRARLFSLWVIEDGKIVLCDELSRMELGTAEDRDLGSRTSKRQDQPKNLSQ